MNATCFIACLLAGYELVKWGALRLLCLWMDAEHRKEGRAGR